MTYHFAAEIPQELAQEVRQMIELVRTSSQPEAHREEGADLVLRLTEACLDSYFIRPARALKVGLVTEKAVTVGVRAAHRAIALFVRRIAGGLSREQVLTLADILEGMLLVRR